MTRKLEINGYAHQSREQTNAARADKSLEDWSLSVVPPRAGMRILDVGCGAGKLILPYCQKILPGGTGVGVDIAPESIAKVRARAGEAGITNIDAKLGNLDTIVADLAGEKFDLIVSSYAIYYATDMVALLKDLRSLLGDGGELFVCGPGEGTNREMAQLLRRVVDPDICPKPQQDFISAVQIANVAGAYSSVELSRMLNEIRFDKAEALLGWWRNHSSHVASFDDEVARAVTEQFKLIDEFRLTKNVLGVLFRA